MPVTSNIQPFDDYFAKRIMTRNDASWVVQNRVEAYARFKALGLPTRALEAWHYTSLKRLGNMDFAASNDAEMATSSRLPDAVVALIPANAVCLVFDNGVYNAALSTPIPYPRGLSITRFGEFARDDKAHVGNFLEDGELSPADSLIYLNAAVASDGLRVAIPVGTKLATPLIIVQITDGEAADSRRVPFTALRHAITLGDNATASVCELHFARSESPHLANTFTRFKLGKGARLHYARVGIEPVAARSIAVTWADVDSNATFTALDFGFGADLCRRETRARLLGAGASVQLTGLGAVKTGRHWDTQVSVQHLSPNAVSRQVYKNIVSDGARAIFNGKVLVAKDAQHTNASQINRNLLLGPGAEADTKPELEILADDVKVSHGATVGRPNPEELFYLMSRAIPEQDAMGMLLRGFAGEITATAPAGLARGLNHLMEEEFFT